MKAFKIMKVSDQDNSWKTLFHGVDGDRNIQCDRWIGASNDWVRDAITIKVCSVRHLGAAGCIVSHVCRTHDPISRPNDLKEPVP